MPVQPKFVFRSIEVKMNMKSNLVFGIYPGGAAGSDSLTGLAVGKPDNPLRINNALDELQPPGKSFLVRSYLHYVGDGKIKNQTPGDPGQYLSGGRKLDLVLGYQSVSGDITDWLKFIRRQISYYGDQLAKIQVAEEPNLRNVPYVDGDTPNVQAAVIQGVITAREEIAGRGLKTAVGFNGVPTFSRENKFWEETGKLANEKFHESLDYVGLDFFPDVFRPVPQEDLEN